MPEKRIRLAKIVSAEHVIVSSHENILQLQTYNSANYVKLNLLDLALSFCLHTTPMFYNIG